MTTATAKRFNADTGNIDTVAEYAAWQIHAGEDAPDEGVVVALGDDDLVLTEDALRAMGYVKV